MTIEIKQSTTTYPLVFMMVDSTDHVTGKTGLAPTVTISKAGAAFASPAGAVSEIGSGWYKVAGNATDSATLGPLILHATGTGADPVDVVYNVSARLVDDLATPTNITAGTITTVTNLTNLPSIPANWLTAAGIATSALDGKGDWNVGKTGYSLSQTFPANFSSFSITAGGLVTLAGVTHTGAVIPTVTTLTGHTAQTGDSFARIGATGSGLTTLATQSLLTTVAGYIDTEVAAIKAKTDNLPASPAAVGDIPTAVENADALLGRNVSGGSSTGRTVKQALHFIRNKWTVAGGTLTVYETDDTTSSWTSAVTGTSGADPITSTDPS